MLGYNTIKDYEYSEHLDGYVVEFKSGHVINTQYSEITDRLSAYYGDSLLERYEEYDEYVNAVELTEEECRDLELFIYEHKDKDVYQAERTLTQQEKEDLDKLIEREGL